MVNVLLKALINIKPKILEFSSSDTTKMVTSNIVTVMHMLMAYVLISVLDMLIPRKTVDEQ